MKGFEYDFFFGEDGQVIDTTVEKDAVDAGLEVKGHKFQPKIIKVGERHLLPVLDAHLEALTAGKHKVLLPPEEAFGKKSAKLLKLVPMSVLKKNNINPYVGQPLDIDGQRGVIRVASGGRTIVDFNHPLAGQSIEYDLEIIGEEKDLIKQAEAMLQMLNVAHEGVLKDEKGIIVTFKENLPKEFTEILGTELKRLLNVEIKIVKKEEKPEVKK